MKTQTKRQKFLFQGNWAWPALVGFLVNLFAISSVLAQAPGATKLLFLGNKNIAPVVYLDQETPKGVAVDIVRALAPHLPQPIEIKAMDWLEAQALVARGEADALIQINQTEERDKIYDFSEPLLESQFSIFTRTDKVGIAGISSLAGLQVGVEAGGLPRQLLEKYPAIRLTIIPDFLTGFKLLSAGGIDAVVVDYRVGSYVIAENKLHDIRVSGEPIAFSYSAIAVREGNTKLLGAINNALQIIKTDGSYQKIIDKWKPKEVVFETREQITHRIYYLTILLLLVLILMAVIWTLTVRRELAKRRAAEGRLQAQYATLRGIINSTNALIFSVDRQYRYTSFNLGHAASMKALYGVQIELGHSLLDSMSVTEDREAARQNLDRALAGEQVVKEAFSGEELRSRQYFQVSHSPIRSEEGITGVAVLAQDMTERKRAEEAQQRLNRELRAISDCNQVLVRAEDEPTLLNDICRIVCEEAGYRMAWVGYAENDAGMTIKPVAWAGVEAGYLADLDITWADTERGNGPGGTAIRSGRTVHVQDFAADPQTLPWREPALQRGYRSCVALPLKDESAKVFGVLLIYSAEINAFSPDEIRLLEELAGDLAFGIMVLRTRTEHKQAEQALRRLTHLQRTILDNVAYGVISTNSDGMVTSFNPAAERLLGYTADEVVGKQTPAYWHDPEEIVRHALQLSEELGEMIAPGFDVFAARPRRNLPEENEWTFIRKEGSRIPVNLSVTALRDEGAQITGFVGLAYDLTERKRAEEALRREQALLSRIMVTSPVGIAVVSRQGHITFANPQAERILGLSKEEITLRSYNAPEWHTTAVDGGLFPDEAQPFSRVMATRQPVFDVQHAIVWPDGRRVLLSINGAPIFDGQGEIEAVAFAIEDITERKRVEDAMSFVAQRGWQTSGENFFDALAQFLGEKLEMDYVLIDRIDENPDMAETVALYAKGAITPNMRYALKGTPCENVMGRRLCVYPHGIQQLFPEDTLLPGMGAESYIGIPLWDSTGQPVGLIAVMGNKPLPDDAPVTQLLQLVATRAAAELERERSNRVLRAREHEFRTLAENLPDNIVRYDLEGRTMYVNPVLEETLGADAARMLGRRIRELYPDGSYEAYAQAADAALSSGKNGEIELTLPVPGKEPIVHQIRMIVERDEQGEVSGLLAIGRDITELKRAEQALQERERHSQSLLHLSRNLEHSQTYAEVLQAAQGEVANILGYRNLWVYLLSEDKAHLKALVASGPESGVVMSEEGTATLTIAGDKMLEEIAQAKEIVLVEDARTDPRVNQEIVARLAMRTIVNVPIILSGRHLGSVGVGTFGEEGVRIPTASEQRYLSALASHLAAALDRIQLLAARKKDAQELLRYKDHLEEQVQHRTADLVLARNAAEAANRAKSVFLSSMSHELRTPLNAILGFSNMMRKDVQLQSEQRQHLDIINRSGEHLLNLINDVLEMAKIEAGRVQVERAPFDLGSLVRDVTDMMHVRAREKGLQLWIDQSSEFPRYIRGDEGRLRQVLINLLGNAVKFTRQGGVTVRFGLKPLAKPQRLLIEVQDSGIGISADDQKRVFEPFVQFGETAAQQGTGLGLSISRQFVQLMGGTISFESTLGQGSTFRLELPLERVAAADVLKPQGADRGEIVGLAPDQPVYRILIVEDQLDNQLLLTKLMKNVGFEVKVAANGAQALDLFQSWRPHLIWMDRRMPVMDGLEATRRIRELPAGAEVKIVAVTASVFTDQRDEMLQAGMDDFVRKPYRFNEIYECMTRQLGVRYKYAQARAEEEVSDVVLTSEMLVLLSPDRRRELRDALENLDGERISAVMAQIASLDSKLHKTLSQLIENFDYPAILKALQTNQPAKPT